MWRSSRGVISNFLSLHASIDEPVASITSHQWEAYRTMLGYSLAPFPMLDARPRTGKRTHSGRGLCCVVEERPISIAYEEGSAIAIAVLV